jgi:hypothetical protein
MMFTFIAIFGAGYFLCLRPPSWGKRIFAGLLLAGARHL